MELELGVLSIERKNAVQGALLRAWLEQHVLPEFAGRTLPVDTAVAQRCARLHVPDQRGERDALIAATTLVHGNPALAADATRYTHESKIPCKSTPLPASMARWKSAVSTDWPQRVRV